MRRPPLLLLLVALPASLAVGAIIGCGGRSLPRALDSQVQEGGSSGDGPQVKDLSQPPDTQIGADRRQDAPWSKPDGQAKEGGPTSDGQQTVKDLPQPLDLPQLPDTFVWPDQTKDTPWPSPDGYTATPFGCQTADDCFGQQCCATPWGVKLCAPTCDY